MNIAIVENNEPSASLRIAHDYATGGLVSITIEVNTNNAERFDGHDLRQIVLVMSKQTGDNCSPMTFKIEKRALCNPGLTLSTAEIT